MSSAATIAVKGWCPGALRPMPSGDGLLVRVRPRCGAFTLEQADGLAAISERLGNAQIDLTRRANLQLRGLRPESITRLHRDLERLRLLDRDPESEALPNVMVGPLSGVDRGETMDVRPIARELADAQASDPSFATLPAMFGWLVDGGGQASIAGERADVALCATSEGMAVRLDTHWLGVGPPRPALAAALAIARALIAMGAPGRVRDMPPRQLSELRSSVVGLAPMSTFPSAGSCVLGLLEGAVALAAPFGRVEARQLRALIEQAAKAGAAEVRLSPWRALFIPTANGEDLIATARAEGWIDHASDPLLQIDACPGAPACASATVDTRRAARLLAAANFKGSIHVSGCAKGCARSTPADRVAVGELGRYLVVRNGTARDAAERTVDAGDVLAVLHG